MAAAEVWDAGIYRLPRGIVLIDGCFLLLAYAPVVSARTQRAILGERRAGGGVRPVSAAGNADDTTLNSGVTCPRNCC